MALYFKSLYILKVKISNLHNSIPPSNYQKINTKKSFYHHRS